MRSLGTILENFYSNVGKVGKDVMDAIGMTQRNDVYNKVKLSVGSYILYTYYDSRDNDIVLVIYKTIKHHTSLSYVYKIPMSQPNILQLLVDIDFDSIAENPKVDYQTHNGGSGETCITFYFNRGNIIKYLLTLTIRYKEVGRELIIRPTRIHFLEADVVPYNKKHVYKDSFEIEKLDISDPTVIKYIDKLTK